MVRGPPPPGGSGMATPRGRRAGKWEGKALGRPWLRSFVFFCLPVNVYPAALDSLCGCHPVPTSFPHVLLDEDGAQSYRPWYPYLSGPERRDRSSPTLQLGLTMFSFCAPTGVLALALSILPHTSASYLAPLPARTAVPHFPISQVYPLPTKAPSPPGALLARDDETSSIETALMAPDNVCGYISGRPGAEYGCAPSAQCVFFTAKTTQDGNLVCCNTDTCAGQITCMDYQQVVESSRCDDGCMVDTFTLKWYVSSWPLSLSSVPFPSRVAQLYMRNQGERAFVDEDH